MEQKKDINNQQFYITMNILFAKKDDIEISEALRRIDERWKQSFKPDLCIEGTGYRGSKGELHIDIINKRGNAKLIELECYSEDITLSCLHLPYELEQGQYYTIIGKEKEDKCIQYCNYKIDLIYTDTPGNKYLAKIIGTNEKANIIETKEID